MAYRASGYGYPVPAPVAASQFYGSARLSDELKQEEDFLATRRQLYSDLRQSEAAEAQAAEKLMQDQRTAEVRTAEAAELQRLSRSMPALLRSTACGMRNAKLPWLLLQTLRPCTSELQRLLERPRRSAMLKCLLRRRRPRRLVRLRLLLTKLPQPSKPQLPPFRALKLMLLPALVPSTNLGTAMHTKLRMHPFFRLTACH